MVNTEKSTQTPAPATLHFFFYTNSCEYEHKGCTNSKKLLQSTPIIIIQTKFLIQDLGKGNTNDAQTQANGSTLIQNYVGTQEYR